MNLPHLTGAALELLAQLRALVNALSDEDFMQPSVNLSGSTLGQHIRHTLEFFLCLEHGLESGNVNYDHRRHDKSIETHRELALNTITIIERSLGLINPDLKLNLEVCYNKEADEPIIIPTTLARELAYNIEHCVHHMAIMKIGIRELAPYITLPRNFGVAASTIRHQSSLTSVK